MTTHLWQCCDPDLEAKFFKDIHDIATFKEASLLVLIKKLAVISIAASVCRTKFLSLHQDHGQPVMSFAAKVKGKAQTCSFNKTVQPVTRSLTTQTKWSSMWSYQVLQTKTSRRKYSPS